jgi:hypothetical protein
MSLMTLLIEYHDLAPLTRAAPVLAFSGSISASWEAISEWPNDRQITAPQIRERHHGCLSRLGGHQGNKA